MRTLLAITIALTVSVTANAAATDTVASVNIRIAARESLLWRIPSMTFDNPATRQWMLPVSYSDISASYSHESANRAVDPQEGKGSGLFGIRASSYMKYRSSTLWGSAAYTNGILRSVVWNESADKETVGPYVIADSVGGNMRAESYSFSGGYADHNERWAWGVALGYEAGLYYRNVDPRPRNTTNRLDISAGASMRLGASDYAAGLSLSYRKYKQTASLMFVNEMSNNRFWHLTGLGTHYERFESLGNAHYYTGNRFGVALDLFPRSRRGFAAAAGWRHMKLDHILTTLNKLPLQTLTDNDLSAQGSWLAPGAINDWAVSATFRYARRTGAENIFGNPSAGIYPHIGSIDMYHRTRLSLTASGLWQWHPSASMLLAVEPAVGFHSDHQKYADPQRHINIDRLIPSLRIFASRGFGSLWRASADLSAAFSMPLDSSVLLPWDSSVSAGLQTMERDRADILTKSHSAYSLRLTGSRAIAGGRYALRLSIAGTYRGYVQSIHSTAFSSSLSFIF